MLIVVIQQPHLFAFSQNKSRERRLHVFKHPGKNNFYAQINIFLSHISNIFVMVKSLGKPFLRENFTVSFPETVFTEQYLTISFAKPRSRIS